MTAESLEDHIAELEERNQRRMRNIGIQHEIARAESGFAETGNPLCVWVTIKYCNEKGIPLPTWVMTYLVESAVGVMEIASGPAKEAPERCLETLGFRRPRGQESPFEDWIRWTRREPACLAFARKICRSEAYKNARIDTAAEFKIAETTLDKWLAEFFPGKAKKETWIEYLRQELDAEGPRFNTTLAAYMGLYRTPV